MCQNTMTLATTHLPILERSGISMISLIVHAHFVRSEMNRACAIRSRLGFEVAHTAAQRLADFRGRTRGITSGSIAPASRDRTQWREALWADCHHLEPARPEQQPGAPRHRALSESARMRRIATSCTGARRSTDSKAPCTTSRGASSDSRGSFSDWP
jgi:hypothetical protein